MSPRASALQAPTLNERLGRKHLDRYELETILDSLSSCCLDNEEDRARVRDAVLSHFEPLIAGLVSVNRLMATELDRRSRSEEP